MRRRIFAITIFLITFLFAGTLVYASGSDRRAYIPERSETENPESEQPTEAAPTDSGDSSETPTEAPTEAPTEQPTSEQPTSEEPTSEQPTSEEPTSEQPTSEQPTSEQPTSEQGGNQGGNSGNQGGKASDTDAKKPKFTVTTTTSPSGMVVYDTSAINALKQQMEATRKDKVEVQQLINELMTAQNDFIERLRELDELIIEYQDDIDALEEQQKIAINTSIDLEEQLKEAQQQEAEQYEKLKNHIRVDYENNRYTYLDAIFNAVDFNAVMNEFEYINSLEDYDQQLFSELEEKRKSIANKKLMMDALDEDIEAIKKTKIAQQEAIELLSEEKVKQIESYNTKINDAKNALATIDQLLQQSDAKLLALEQEYRRKLQLSSSPNIKFDGSLLWPMPSSTQMTSPFGGRVNPITGASEGHSGVDIACEMGSPVIAPAPGRVFYVGWMGTGGNCVQIDIGSGMTVFFYHLSEFNCKEGDMVSAGQVVAFSGSTGMSTGPHLHYGIKVNGTPVDPLQFY